MELNVQKLLKNPDNPLEIQTDVDLSRRDFPGYALNAPVAVGLRARAEGGEAVLDIEIDALVRAECARCLAPLESRQRFAKQYRVREEDLAGEYPELPVGQNGGIDVDELVYGEVLIEVPGVLLCREDCEGLCQRCGKPAQNCRCEEEPEGDPRMQVLRQLLENGGEDAKTKAAE